MANDMMVHIRAEKLLIERVDKLAHQHKRTRSKEILWAVELYCEAEEAKAAEAKATVQKISESHPGHRAQFVTMEDAPRSKKS